MADFKLSLSTIMALLSCIIVSGCKIPLRNSKNSKLIQSSPGTFTAEKRFYIPNERQIFGERNTVDDNEIFGPHLPRKECPMNYKFLDPWNIETTRKEIDRCTDRPLPCDHAAHSKYRTIDGSCNNLKHPTWGKSDMCLKRILPFDYGDKISYPRMSCTGKPLPSSRHISNVFHKEIIPRHGKQTTHFMAWGQVVSHDLSLNDIFRSPETGYNRAIKCCEKGPVYDDFCVPIAVPPSDPFYSKLGLNCISIPRTIPCNHCKKGPRVHWNQNTAYHDLSLVYGSTEEEAQKHRSKSRGMLRVTYNVKSGPMLPTVYRQEECTSRPNEKKCYSAGDPRSNQTPFLLTAHTYLLRYHNYICQELNKINPHWDDEKLYQEARRINIAIAQYITYGKYLPHALGEIMEKEGISVLPGAQYTAYDAELDASILDEYSSFAGRYGHTQIPGRISEIDPKTNYKDTILLRDYYYKPFGFGHGQYDKVAKGMLIDKPMKHDIFFSDDVRNYLYRMLYLNITIGDDIAALSIVRGRDHGLPGYTYYLAYFFNIFVRTFNDFRKVLPDKYVDLLEQLYESIHDVEIYSAGLAENYVPGGFVGPTFGAVLGEQYRRVKFGDRYWFEHGNEAGSFTPEQLLEIKNVSLSRVLCETTRITEIQLDAFMPASVENPVLSCDKLHKFDFLPWKE